MSQAEVKSPSYLYQVLSQADLIDLSRSIGFKSMPRKGSSGQEYILSAWTTPEAAWAAAVSPVEGEPLFLTRIRPAGIPGLQHVSCDEAGAATVVSGQPFVIDLHHAEVQIAHPQTHEPVWMAVSLYRLAPGELSPPGSETKAPWKPKMSRAAWFAMKRRLGQLQPRRAA